jgi:archaetidylinositol phosphate synthase
LSEKNRELEEAPNKRRSERRLLDRIIEKPVAFLIELNVSPDLLSFLGLLCSLGACIFIALGFIHGFFFLTWIPPFLMVLAGALDVFDGEVARSTNQVGPEGAYLDSNIDRISDSVIILGLIYGGLIDFLVGFFILFLMIMISYTRARAEVENVDMKGIGWMERAERLLMLVFGLIIEIYVYAIIYWITGLHFKLFFPLFMYLFLTLLVITLGQRFYHTWRALT